MPMPSSKSSARIGTRRSSTRPYRSFAGWGPTRSISSSANSRPLLTRYRRDLEKVNRELDKLAGPAEEKRKAEEARLRWEARRREARAFIADQDVFIDVFDRPMVSPGADTAKDLGDAAFDAFNVIEPGLRKDLKKYFKLSAKAALKLREKHFAAKTACARVLTAMGLSGGGEGP